MRATLLVGAVLVFVFGLAILRFDAGRYKTSLTAAVRDRIGRTLTVTGRIRLAVVPRLALEVDDASLSERGSTREFASVRHLSAAVALWPLLRDDLVIGRVELSGLALHLRRLADGTDNFSDLIPAKDDKARTDFDIAGISLSDVVVDLDDEPDRERARLEIESMSVDRLAPDRPARFEGRVRAQSERAHADAKLSLHGSVQVSKSSRQISLSDVRVEGAGRIAGLDFEGGTIETSLAVDGAGNGVAVFATAIHATLPHDIDRTDVDARIARAALRAGTYDVAGPIVQLVTKGGATRREVSIAADRASGPAAAVSVGALRVRALGREGTLDWRFGIDGNAEVDVSALRVRTDELKLDGGLENGTTRLHAEGRARVEADPRLAVADGLEGQISGSAAGWSVSGPWRARLDEDSVASTARLSNVEIQLHVADATRSGDVVLAGAAELDTKTLALREQAVSLRAALASPAASATLQVTGRLGAEPGLAKISLESLGVSGEVSHGRPAARVRVSLAGSARAERAPSTTSVVLRGTIDGAKCLLDARHGVPGGWHVNADAERLDLTPWIAATSVPTPTPQPGTPGPPFDVGALKALELEGRIDVGVLTVADTTMKRVRIELGRDAKAEPRR